MGLDFDGVGLGDNPEPRCPCVLLLDNSGSMRGDPLDQLNEGLRVFQQSLVGDDLARMRVEVAIISFGPVTLVQDFVSAEHFVAPVLPVAGDTPMGQATKLALEKIEERKQIYRQNGISYYRPWIFLITDGAPTDGGEWTMAAQRVREAEAAKKLSFFGVGVEGANLESLRAASARPPMRLKGLSFQEMFVWLSSSLTAVSHSQPTDDVVPLQSPLTWGAA